MAKKENRCWPGYEPVQGKRQHEQGSCRPKSEGKLTSTEKQFRGKRAKQLAEWKKEHPKSPKKAAQHLHKPEEANVSKTKSPAKTASKRTVSKKTASKKRAGAMR